MSADQLAGPGGGPAGCIPSPPAGATAAGAAGGAGAGGTTGCAGGGGRAGWAAGGGAGATLGAPSCGAGATAGAPSGGTVGGGVFSAGCSGPGVSAPMQITVHDGRGPICCPSHC